MNNLFGLYYINLDKVYELKTILSKFELISRTVDNELKNLEKLELKAGVSASDGLVSSGYNVTAMSETSNAFKVSDAFKVKNTKSNILNYILPLANEKDKLQESDIGSLILIKNVNLKLENENLVRVIKMLSQNIIKEKVAEGININKTINAMTKDYFYLLSTKNSEMNIIFKIPIAIENEFESQYTIDDIILGKVNILGVYKGLIKGKELNNTFEYFKNLTQKNSLDNDISSSTDNTTTSDIDLSTNLNEDDDYCFIDILAITQDINIKKEDKTKKICWLKKIFCRKK